MASSGSFTTDSCQSRSLKFSWSVKSQSVANNTTTISWKLVGSGSASGYVKCGGFYVKINGVVKVDKSTDYRVNVYNGTTVASGTATIKHNSDGTKKFSASAKAGIYYYERNCDGSGSWSLPTIARASSVESASNTTLGETCDIKWTPASSSFYYKVKLTLGDWSWTSDAIHPNKTSEYTYTTPSLSLNVAKQLPSATSGTMTAYLYTYSNSSCETQIGSTSSKTFTVTVPSSIIPTIESMSVSVVNSNSVVNEWGLYVKGYSKVKISCTAKGSYESTIKSYTLSGGYSTSVTSMPYTGDTIKSSGTVTFKCVAKDSRGRSSATSSKDITVYNYYSPSITLFTVERDSSNGSKMTAKVNYSFASVNSKNSATATLYYKKSTSSSWTTYGTIAKNTSVVLNKTFDEAVSYNFKVVVKDSLSKTAQEETFVSTIQVLMDFRSGGKGLGIGKICESDALEVGFDAKFTENVYIDGIEFGKHKILWSGGYYMKDTQEISLSETISSQPNGIVLVFSRYSDEAAQDYNFNTFFIPKNQALAHNGAGHFFFMGASPNLSLLGCKYLYVYNNKIVGHADNTNSGTGSGIAFDNSAFVLRYVIGI